jgi:hypothetical protein
MSSSTLPQNNKIFRFDSALNWEEEDQRTARGIEARRGRKQRKKQRKMIREEQLLRLGRTFAILQDRGQHEAVIGLLCADRLIFRWNLIGFLSTVTDIGGPLLDQWMALMDSASLLTQVGAIGDTLEEQLNAFRDPARGFQLQGLNPTPLSYLKMLAFYPGFAQMFFPATIISASSSDNETTVADFTSSSDSEATADNNDN